MRASKLVLKDNSGGVGGFNHLLKTVDGDYIGHIYIDASEGIDGLQVVEDMVKAYNEKLDDQTTEA